MKSCKKIIKSIKLKWLYKNYSANMFLCDYKFSDFNNEKF